MSPNSVASQLRGHTIMMKSGIIFLAIVALFGDLATSQRVNCTFHETATDYVCNLIGQNIQEEVEMLDIGGVHLPERFDMHVTSLISSGGTVMRVFPSFMINRFINLRSVAVQSANMTTFQTPINHCPQLASVLIGNNQLTTIPNNFFQSCSSLTMLSMMMNSISVISPNAFTGLVNLNSLILTNNQIQILAPNVFAPLVGLQNLFLNSNQIAEISAGTTFNTLTNLTLLNLDDNLMSFWSGHNLVNNNLLQTLSISRNRIQTLVVESFNNLNALRELTLTNNQLQGLPVFKILPSLETLNLNDNQITSIDGNWFRNMPRLHMLLLNGNQIREVDFTMNAGRLQSPVRFLHLMSNQIENLQDNAFTMLSNLEQLDLSANQIERLNVLSVRPITQMRRLLVVNNRINRIERELFTGATSLVFSANGNICINSVITINDANDFENRVVPLLRECFSSAISMGSSLIVVITSVLASLIMKI